VHKNGCEWVKNKKTVELSQKAVKLYLKGQTDSESERVKDASKCESEEQHDRKNPFPLPASSSLPSSLPSLSTSPVKSKLIEKSTNATRRPEVSSIHAPIPPPGKYPPGVFPPRIGGSDLNPLADPGSGGMLFDPFSKQRYPYRVPHPGSNFPGAKFDPQGPPGVFPRGSRPPNPDHEKKPNPEWDDPFI